MVACLHWRFVSITSPPWYYLGIAGGGVYAIYVPGRDEPANWGLKSAPRRSWADVSEYWAQNGRWPKYELSKYGTVRVNLPL